MTIAQVCAEFEIEEESEEKSLPDPVQKRAEIFKEIMRICGWSKKRLAECPVDDLAVLVKRIGNQQTVDMERLGGAVQEFCGHSSTASSLAEQS